MRKERVMSQATSCRRPRGARPARPIRTRLQVESLEDRTVPSPFTVLNLDDGVTGSLRQAIETANATPGADVIRFAPQLRGTLTLNSQLGPLNITEDLTL